MRKTIIKLLLTGFVSIGTIAIYAGGVEYIPPPPVYSGFYLEANLGAAFRDWEEEGLLQDYIIIAQGGTAIGGFDDGKSGLVYGFDIGYQWSRLFSGELGYFRLPSVVYTVPQGNLIVASNTMKIRARYLAYVALKFNYPIIENLYVSAKFGAAYLDTEATFSFIPVLGLPQKDDYWTPLFAFGLQYYFNWNWSINAQYTFVPGYARRPTTGMFRKVPVPHANIVMFGVGYKFAV